MDEEMKTTINELINTYEDLLENLDVEPWDTVNCYSYDKKLCCVCWNCYNKKIAYIDSLKNKINA